MLAYSLTIFIGAFLLFQVQPLIGKFILPWFGGGPGVWTTCMVFFQVLLLGGYAYAHVTSRLLKPRPQALAHLAVLMVALPLAQIIPTEGWKPQGGGNPTLEILALLTVCLGGPYFVLASTGPLLQQWLSRLRPDQSPYRLYALSNAGSLLALISYPFVFEAHWSRQAQAEWWAWGFVAYVLCCGFCAVRLWKANPAEDVSPVQEGALSTAFSRPTLVTKLLWLLWPACATVLLLATTNKMCQDVAVIPFLWVLPLALYLTSFIICFDNPRWHQRTPFTVALVAAMVAMCWALFQGTDASLRAQVIIYSLGLFVCCLVCHGELYRLRPDPRHLTGFYLMIAGGGALGGMFVALAAPVLFDDFHELHWGLLLCWLLLLVVCLREENAANAPAWRGLAGALTLVAFAGLDRCFVWLSQHQAAFAGTRLMTWRIGLWSLFVLLVALALVRRKLQTFRQGQALACIWLGCGLVALALVLRIQAGQADAETVCRSRNFYGPLAVCEYRKDDPKAHYYLLQHGRITHGIQFADRERAMWPTSYYCAGSGIALAVDALPPSQRRFGVVGLGTGTMAVFGRAGDTVRIYEINPEVQRIATTWFTHLSNCPAKVEVVLGDARLSLEREPPQRFDLLALDAFSSDAVPVHLLTKEAFDVYDRHMKPSGIIAVNISNRFLDLEPVVLNLARRFKYEHAIVEFEEGSGGDEEDEEGGSPWWHYSSTWVLLTRDDAVLKSPPIRSATSAAKTNTVSIPLWTDDFASLFQILQ